MIQVWYIVISLLVCLFNMQFHISLYTLSCLASTAKALPVPKHIVLYHRAEGRSEVGVGLCARETPKFVAEAAFKADVFHARSEETDKYCTVLAKTMHPRTFEDGSKFPNIDRFPFLM